MSFGKREYEGPERRQRQEPVEFERRSIDEIREDSIKSFQKSTNLGHSDVKFAVVVFGLFVAGALAIWWSGLI